MGININAVNKLISEIKSESLHTFSIEQNPMTDKFALYHHLFNTQSNMMIKDCAVKSSGVDYIFKFLKGIQYILKNHY